VKFPGFDFAPFLLNKLKTLESGENKSKYCQLSKIKEKQERVPNFIFIEHVDE